MLFNVHVCLVLLMLLLATNVRDYVFCCLLPPNMMRHMRARARLCLMLAHTMRYVYFISWNMGTISRIVGMRFKTEVQMVRPWMHYIFTAIWHLAQIFLIKVLCLQVYKKNWMELGATATFKMSSDQHRRHLMCSYTHIGGCARQSFSHNHAYISKKNWARQMWS